jgi:dTDP-4-dehydrorhamnose reductase
MKVLVTGSEGQLAREVTRVSVLKGHEVLPMKKKELDIKDPDAVLQRLSKTMPDIVINCAAYNDVDGAEANLKEAILVNGMGPKNLALSSKKIGAALVHFSTDYVFDGEKTSPYKITDMPNPISTYGHSKLMGEQSVMTLADRHFLIRTSWVFGEGRFSFPKKVLEWASKNDKLRIVDDQISCPSYAADLADALMELIETRKYGLYHMTNSGHTSRYGWAAFILDMAGWHGRCEPAKSTEFPTPAKRPAYSALDNSPLQEVIGRLLPSWQDATDRFLKKISMSKEKGLVTP